MTILVSSAPTFVLPIFRQTGYLVEFKPFASYYQWATFFDFSEFDTRITAIEAGLPADLAATLADMVAATSTAQTTADSAVTAAAAAQSTANGAVSTNTSQAASISANAAAAAAAQSTANTALSNSTTNAGLLPSRGHFHSEEQAVITGTEARNTDATYPFAGGKYTSTQNAVIEFYLTCRAGAHLIVSVLAQKSSASGVITMYLDGTLVNTSDHYAAVTDKNFSYGQTTSAIAQGDHVLSFKCLTKNGSSSGYIMFINFVKWTVS